MGNDFGLVVFDSTHAAIQTQTLLEQAQLKNRMLTTPGNLSAGCGLSIYFDLADLGQITRLLQQQQVTYRALYQVHKDGLHSQYQLIKNEVRG